MRPKRKNSGVVLWRSGETGTTTGTTTINIAEDNKIYVVHQDKAAFATQGAKGVVYFDREKFNPPKEAIAEVSRLLGVQRSNRIKNWNRSSNDHYEKHELELVTEF